jgi:methionyl-tRNA synthetase
MADIEEKNATAAQSSQPAAEQQLQLPVDPNPPGGAPALVPPTEETVKPEPINVDDFAKIELRVAKILVAERIPKADKLLRLEVDLGYEKRQILSGIAEWYAPEDLIGRRIVVITNLAPRKMRGLESHGMLLAASETEGSKPVLATFDEEIALGSRLK